MANNPMAFRKIKSRRPTWQLVSFAALIAGTLAVVVAALIMVQPAVSDETVPPPSYDLAGSHPRTTGTPEPTAADEPSAAPTRTIVAISDVGAWRSLIGACPSGPVTPEYTVDGGASWKPSTSTGPLGISSVLRLARGDGGSVDMVGQAPAACAPQTLTTNARKDRWAPSTEAVQAWYVVPGTPSTINTPAGIRPTPCAAVIDVEPGVGEHAAVLCDNQRFFRSSDGGATWDGGIFVAGSRTFAPSADGYLVAATGQPECEGVQLRVVYPKTAPRDGAPLGCKVTKADTTEVALSVIGESVWLWVGDEIAVTSDRGITWR
ncbi:MAG: hypothetical protein JWQ68_2448 [Cryobacterium sp.]|jgi:hypothetical protein|nr:hypothetical protein [Cryobacterium sp.]